MQVKVTTPNRIDLAGGTLDIWPLYAFAGGGYTVNAAIDLTSEVTIATRDDTRFELYSVDMDDGEEAPSLDALTFGGPMDLVVRALKVYRPRQGLSITTRNLAPKGTGLGASSALLIALSAGLWELEGRPLDKQRIIDIAANIEAQCINVPTGKQDYYAAAYGGVNAIWFGLDGNRVEPLLVDPGVRTELDQRLTLTFTGESRFSGTSNWNMLKAYVEDLGATRHNMRVIQASSERMRDSLMRGDLAAFGDALAAEWEARKGLAHGVTTARIESLMAVAKSAGALASKICGAGGGGCMISFCKHDAKARVEAALSAQGAQVLPFTIRPDGIVIERD